MEKGEKSLKELKELYENKVKELYEKSVKQLKELYESSLTTGSIKSEAFENIGVSGNYFRLVVTGTQVNGKPFSSNQIIKYYLALKKAHNNDYVKRIDFYHKIGI